MLPALQPSRPKYPPTAQPPLLPLQQTRQTFSQESSNPSTTSTSSPNIPHRPSQPQPRSQIEAMPPAFAPPSFVPPPGPVLQPRLSNTPLSQHYDTSIRHPVFFSPALRKPPFPLPDASSRGVNPVAHGYVIEDGVNAPRGVRTKL